MRTQVQNLWQAINSIETGEGGNMTYVGTDGSIGRHYMQNSLDGKSVINSRLIEDGDNFDFGGNNLISVGNITANSFIKSEASSSDFLKGDGSIDSNAYLTASDLLNYVPKVGDSTISGNLEATSFKKTGGTSSEFLKADGSSDSSRFYISGANLAIGPNSLISNTSGIGNEAIGFGTLKDNTEGNYNNAVGVNALMNNTTGVYNMAFGLSSLYTNITGNYNTGIGARSDVSSDNLTNATAVGYNAIVNASNTIQLGDGNITTVNTSGNITANSFVKSGGTEIQYLMANGSTLTQSANSGNSNFYLYDSGTSQSPNPVSGFITYNNATQSNATMIYISHKTRDNIDIEVYFKQITKLTDVYIQDENTSANFIQFNITGTPTITTEAQVAIPVLVRGIPGTTGFADGHNVIISFFTNGLEVDQRLSNLETKTTYQNILAGNTNFSTGITIGNNYITTTQGVFNASGQLVSKNYVDTAIGIGTNNTTERWVNSYIGVDTNSGSIMKPLLTINAGFGNSAQYPLKLNIRGVFTTLQNLTGTNSNLQITTSDGYEAQQSNLTATVITSGTMTRLKMSGFTITTGSSAVLTIGDTLGRHSFSNMQFVSSNATPITFTSGFTNWCNFQDCDFSGLVSSGTASPITLPNLSGTAILRLYNCGVINLITGTGWVVYISGSTVLTTSGTTTPPTNLASGTIIQLPFNSFNAVLTSSPVWSTLPVGNYINMVVAGLSTTGLIGTPTLGCCVIKIATGYQVVSLGYNQLPSSISVLNGSNYDTWVRTSGAVGWVVVNQSAYVPLVGGVSLTGQVSTNQTPTLSTHLVPKSYVDTFLPKAGGSVSGVIDMGSSGSITSNQTIFAGTNFVTKTYVDNAVSTGGGSYLPLGGGTLTGNLILQRQLILNNQSAFAMNTGSIYYNGATAIASVPTFFGNLLGAGINNGAVAQTTTNNATKIPLTQFTNNVGVANTAGIIGSNTTYLSGQSLYVGLGFNFSCSFGFGETSLAINKNGFICGFVTDAPPAGWANPPSSLPSWFGVGNDPLTDNTFFFISNGTVGYNRTATSYPVNVASNDVYTLNVYNPVNSNTIFLTLSSVLTTGQSSASYTLSTATSTGVSINQRIYPVLYRYYGSGSTSLLLNFGKMTFTSFT